MGSAKQNKPLPNDRRARLDEMRRQARARDRRNRIITVTASVAVVAALVVGGTYLFTAAEEKQKADAAPVEGVRTWKDLGREHVDKAVSYKMAPPAGGDHSPAWMNCNADVYDKEIPNENAVHSLEHGAVWVTYNSKAAEADVEKLSDKVSATPYSLMSPYKDQESPIALSAWGHRLEVKDASDPRIDRFFKQYVQGPQTPEPGAACTGGVGA
ncbi:DUF3105 domain-containing protein [Streptomyces sp. NPDC059506]|uniref:DUF3105 domain-containing protein n=1 Tax=Streptomyces TaxID=1883 RepID=UPI000CB86676|nr:DUF3105 domain-containing protein [Streptomyces sp. SCUT-3]PLW74160.1 hypothetical protein C0036_03400 [Streptomyces sp. DJ]QMV23060.1 DUF3105 domain-containing protein [Streptomyces sp. SCUT-3]